MNEESRDSTKRKRGTLVHPEDMEDPRYEDMNDEEEGANEEEESEHEKPHVHDTTQDVKWPTPNLGAQSQVKKQEEFTEKDIKPKIATTQPEPCDTQLIIVKEDISSSDRQDVLSEFYLHHHSSWTCILVNK
ncbi:hypothetical protein KI387_018409, partial [Taxus chinensis]